MKVYKNVSFFISPFFTFLCNATQHYVISQKLHKHTLTKRADCSQDQVEEHFSKEGIPNSL